MKFVAGVLLVVVAAALAAVMRRDRGRAETGRRPTPSYADRRTLPGPWRLAALAAVVLVPTIAIAVITSTSGFVWDDIKNLRQAQVEGLSLDYLFEPTSGHWGPGHRFGDWFLQRLFPFNFPAAQAMMLVGFAASLVLFHRLAADLFRPGPGALVLTLVYGASLVHTGVVQWWASGLDRVPATFFSFLSMLGYIRFHRTRAWLWYAVSLGALACSFLFYVKPVFVPLYLVLIRVLLLEPERPVRETAADAVREWPVWAGYAVVVGLFAVVYVGTYPTGLNETPTVAEFGRYLWLMWFKVAVPNLFGLYIPIFSRSAVGNVGVALAQLALVGVVAASVMRSRGAWRAWAFFAVGLIANVLIVGLTRIGYFPPRIIASTVYYHLELTFLFFLAVGAAFLRPMVEAGNGRARVPSLGVAAPALAGAAVALYLGFSWHGAVRLSEADIWEGRQAADYVDNAKAGLRDADRAGARLALVDGMVPYEVVPPLLTPYNSFSEVFPLIDEDVEFDVTGRDLYGADRSGRLRPVSFEPMAGGDATSLLVANRMGVVGAPLDRTPTGFCVTARNVTATIGFLPEGHLREEDGLFLRMRFRSGTESVMSILAEPVGGYPPDRRRNFRVVNLHPTSQETVYELGQVDTQYVAVVIAPGAEVCVERFEVGRVVPLR